MMLRIDQHLLHVTICFGRFGPSHAQKEQGVLDRPSNAESSSSIMSLFDMNARPVIFGRSDPLGRGIPVPPFGNGVLNTIVLIGDDPVTVSSSDDGQP